MGAGPWTVYNSMRLHLGDGSINLVSNIFQMSLFLSTSNAADVTMQTIEQLTNEVAPGFGYVAGGQQLQNVKWQVADTPDEMQFTADPLTWNASGGNIVGIRYCVVWRKGTPNLLICFAMVDENQDTTVPSGDPITIAPNVGGIFELN
jgi:hypothetical protein